MEIEYSDKCFIAPDASIEQAMRQIDESSLRAILVVSEDKNLLGMITDGDIRRAILAGTAISEHCEKIMNTSPTTVRQGETNSKILSLMTQKSLLQIPVLDDDGKVVKVETIESLSNPKTYDVDVVLMAGGYGKRLYPLTKDVPKPMLKVGNDKPVLETILERFISHGFKSFTITTHYKSQIIQDYFGDGEKFGVKIQYVQENEPLGTAGALKLLPESLSENFIVMNGDILCGINNRHLVDFHIESDVAATMCLRKYEHTVPYGVVEMGEAGMKSIIEKPTQEFMVSAGIYVLNKSVLEYIPDGEYFDMPQLFKEIIAKDKKTAAFPIHEYWLDIGRKDDLEKAEEFF